MRPFSGSRRSTWRNASGDCAIVSLRPSVGGLTLAISFPGAFVGDAFKDLRVADLTRRDYDGPLCWVLCEPALPGAYPQLQYNGITYRWQKTTGQEVMAEVMGEFPVSPFQVCVKMRLEQLQERPEEMVLALEMEDAFRNFFADRDDTPPAAIAPIPAQPLSPAPMVDAVASPLTADQPALVIPPHIVPVQTEPKGEGTEADSTSAEPAAGAEQTEDRDEE